MGFFDWFKNRRNGTDDRRREWRRAWETAATHPCRGDVPALRAQLEALGLSDDEIEIEREMVDALETVIGLADSVESAGLPVVATGHRVVGSDVCHFIAPASMPDDPAQPSGQLILTNARAIFVGGARLSMAWHLVAGVTQSGRDLVLARMDRQSPSLFRCNSFGDALCAAFLARRLAAPRRR